jgi:hypothetical protein
MSLAKYNRVVQDTAGNGVAGASIEVRAETPGQPLAALYSDRDGLSAIGNPFSAGSDGSFGFHVVGGAYQVRAYTGPSGSPTFEKILRYEPIGLAKESDYIPPDFVEREVTAGGTITATTDDDVILVNKSVGAATSVVLYDPAIATKKKIRIVDRKYDAATNNITITAFDSSSPPVALTIMGGASYVIDSNGGSIELMPLADGTGWV